MAITGRYLRWLLAVAAFVLMLFQGTFRPHIVVVDFTLAAYAATVEIAASFRKRFSSRGTAVLAGCDLLAAALLYFTFPLGLLLVFYPLILFQARHDLGGARFASIAAVAALSYFAAAGAAHALGTESWNLPELLIRFVGYPGFIAAGTALTIRIAKKASGDVELQRDEALRKLNASNDTLATLSHEFRTPLTMIRSSSQILSEERPGPLNDVQRRFLDTIEDNTSRLIRLADDLLARTRVDSTWLTVELEELDVRPLMKNIVEIMTPFAEQRMRRLRYSYPHMLSPVLADPKWIHQVLVNLVHNAIKYTEPEGSIVLSVKENEECAVISVSDDGGGIWSSRTTDVFKKYFRENRHVAGSSDGAGLGLAIVKQVVEKHNGKVYVGSVPGMGSIFSFTLPIVRKVPR